MSLFNRRRLFAVALFSALLTRLGRATGKGRRFTDITEFREFIIAALVKQPGVDSAVADPSDPAKLKITMGGETVAGDLTNVFGYINAYPDEDADKTIERFLRSVTQSKAPTVGDNQIVAVIRSREYTDFFKSKGANILCEPLGADLMITYMADRPDTMSTITSKDVPGKDLQDVRRIALDNIRRWLPKIVSDDGLQSGVLYFVQDNTMLSPSLVLLDEFWKSIETRFPGDVLIAIPRKDQLFIFDDRDSAVRTAVRGLIAGTIRENFNLLSPKLYARRGGKIVLVTD
jgi:uncharacterized protein YtpQ (UPF0354 family)